MKNFEIKIKEIETKLGYKFKDPQLLTLAFIHRSYWNEYKESVVGHNERLEFLGDSVMGLLVADFLYTRFSHLPEGNLTELRAQIVRAESCAHFLEELQLGSYLLLGRGEQTNQGKGRKTMLADLFEAVVGAIYLDGGYQEVARFFFSHFERQLVAHVAAPETNWKAMWQDFAQKILQKPFSYEVVEESGPSHNKEFIVAIKVGGAVVAQGKGKSKKEGEVAAAKEAYHVYHAR